MPSRYFVFTFVASIALCFLPCRCWYSILDEHDYVRACEDIGSKNKKLFLYTYEVHHGGCTVQCTFLHSSTYQYREFLDESEMKMYYFKQEKRCIDENHFCYFGRCRENSTSSSEVMPATLKHSENGDIIIEIKDGYVRRDDGRSKGDPYLIITYGKTKYRTRTQKDTYRPVFNEEFAIRNFNVHDNITVHVYDNDKIKDDHVGTFFISPQKVLTSQENGQFVEYPFGPESDYIVIRLYWTNV